MNLNPIDFNYIDSKNIYPLQEYIDDKFNSIVIPPITNIDSSNILIFDTPLSNVLYRKKDNDNITTITLPRGVSTKLATGVGNFLSLTR